MIRLEKINADNYQKVFDLELVGEQENFVSSNMRSLAQARYFTKEPSLMLFIMMIQL